MLHVDLSFNQVKSVQGYVLQKYSARKLAAKTVESFFFLARNIKALSRHFLAYLFGKKSHGRFNLVIVGFNHFRVCS